MITRVQGLNRPVWIIVIMLGAVGHLRAAESQTTAPWSVTATCPVILPAGTMAFSAVSNRPPPDTMLQVGCTGLLIFYQDILSTLNTVQCPMQPSCSNYSLQAIAKHGAGRGILLTADRLIHEGSEKQYTPLVTVPGRGRVHFDPVENNDFWWYRP